MKEDIVNDDSLEKEIDTQKVTKTCGQHVHNMHKPSTKDPTAV